MRSLALVLRADQSWHHYLTFIWLVTDQLGTPRMIFDKTGSLATTSRHDYLPFGEEVYANTGLCTTTQGYTSAG
ncbi:MAG: hypothetical protein H0U60_04790 [Blastocatellia bacterium]|nr:hypothetical protein [Blastocatellia bacterium]